MPVFEQVDARAAGESSSEIDLVVVRVTPGGRQLEQVFAYDIDDPVGHWQRFSAWQQRIVDWLKGKSEVHVICPETDLRLNVAGLTFINSDGKHNMPSGEVFTGPVEDSVEGHVLFSYPAIYRGREVSGIRLSFEKGKVVQASAEANEDLLLQTLDTDERSRYVGEFAIGTNEGITQFTRQILFDEKINGSFHMALGAGYPETGSKNQSAIHWDMICDMREGGEIVVDGPVREVMSDSQVFASQINKLFRDRRYITLQDVVSER